MGMVVCRSNWIDTISSDRCAGFDISPAVLTQNNFEMEVGLHIGKRSKGADMNPNGGRERKQVMVCDVPEPLDITESDWMTSHGLFLKFFGLEPGNEFGQAGTEYLIKRRKRKTPLHWLGRIPDAG
jgi:hypothetical protein